MRSKHIPPVLFLAVLLWSSVAVSPRRTALAQSACTGVPFTDVSAFCAEIRMAYYTGITAGTSATTFSGDALVTRDQMAAFTTHGLTAALLRQSPRTAAGFFWTPIAGVPVATIGTAPVAIQSDGVDLWIADPSAQKLLRVNHNGAVLGTWTGLAGASDIQVVPGRIIVGATNTSVYAIDPALAPGAVSPFSTAPSPGGAGLAFDGQRIWRPSSTATTLSLLGVDGSYVAEFGPIPTPMRGILFDGTYMWLVVGDGTVRRINPLNFTTSDLLLGVAFNSTIHLGFDGENLWVPNPDNNEIFIIRPASLKVIATVVGNGLNGPNSVAFDGLRMLVTNKVGNSVSLFQAADLTPLGGITFSGGVNPAQGASDGLNFFVIGSGNGQLVKY
jgi:hypothetical protein